jgi:hypothetical protein
MIGSAASCHNNSIWRSVKAVPSGDGVSEARLMQRDPSVAFDHDLAALEGYYSAGVEEVEPLSNSLVSGEFRYLGSDAGSSARAPKAITRDLASRMGMVSRLRKRS